MFEFIKSLFKLEPERQPHRGSFEDRASAFDKVRTLSLRSGALTIDSGGNNPQAVFIEPGAWAVFQSKDADGIVTSVSLVRPKLASAGRLIDRQESGVFVDDGCVTLADSEVYETDRVKDLLELEERIDPKRWPKDFFLSSTGIGDGSFPVSVLVTEEHAFDRLGVMAVVVSFTMTPSERVLRELAATLPAWKEKKERTPAPRNAFARDPLGRYQLSLADRSGLLTALKERQPWTIGDLNLVHGPASGVGRERFVITVSVNPELADLLHRAITAAAAGATLEWAELPDFSIRLISPGS